MTLEEIKNYKQGNQLWWIALFAICLFTLMFFFKKAGSFDFWYWMSSNLLILITLTFIVDKRNVTEIRKDLSVMPYRKALMGILFAVTLFIIFYLGNFLIRQLVDGAAEGIQNVYSFKQQASPLRIGILMLLIIGPGEELFWRGYLQRRLGTRFGKASGFLLATMLYTAVHIATGNIVLVLAALVCGLFWGWLYMKYNSMIINVISHTVWDVGVFLLLPFAS
jgi:membrane protease YdiL (CAAX protease family)